MRRTAGTLIALVVCGCADTTGVAVPDAPQEVAGDVFSAEAIGEAQAPDAPGDAPIASDLPIDAGPEASPVVPDASPDMRIGYGGACDNTLADVNQTQCFETGTCSDLSGGGSATCQCNPTSACRVFDGTVCADLCQRAWGDRWACRSSSGLCCPQYGSGTCMSPP